MGITGAPSKEYQWVLVPEDHPAFRDREAAERDLRKRWAAQTPAQRNRQVLAKVETYFDPDYDVKVAHISVQTGKPEETGKPDKK
jgi:hypothetical protein